MAPKSEKNLPYFGIIAYNIMLPAIAEELFHTTGHNNIIIMTDSIVERIFVIAIVQLIFVPGILYGTYKYTTIIPNCIFD